ncbi:unnamed protein product, partial [Polarella glacialis]
VQQLIQQLQSKATAAALTPVPRRRPSPEARLRPKEREASLPPPEEQELPSAKPQPSQEANGGLSPGSHRGGNAWENSATMQDQMEELENRCRKAEEDLEDAPSLERGELVSDRGSVALRRTLSGEDPQMDWAAWSPNDVGDWVESLIGFGTGEVFRQREVDGPTLMALTDRDLAEALGIADSLHRAKLIGHLRLRQRNSFSWQQQLRQQQQLGDPVAAWPEAPLPGTAALQTSAPARASASPSPAAGASEEAELELLLFGPGPETSRERPASAQSQ